MNKINFSIEIPDAFDFLKWQNEKFMKGEAINPLIAYMLYGEAGIKYNAEHNK